MVDAPRGRQQLLRHVVPSPLALSHVSLTQAGVLAPPNTEFCGQNLRCLGRAYEIAGHDLDPTSPRPIDLSSKGRGGRHGLVATPRGEGWMCSLTLGDAGVVPLRLPMSHEIDRMQHGRHSPVGWSNALSAGTR